MQEVSEKYNNDSYRERHALSVERLRTLPFEESVEDSYIAYFRLVALFLLEVENVRIQVESGKWDQYNEEDMRQINEILYSDIVGDAYEKSYANPKYACSWFEPEMGRLLSFLYVVRCAPARQACWGTLWVAGASAIVLPRTAVVSPCSK